MNWQASIQAMALATGLASPAIAEENQTLSNLTPQSPSIHADERVEAPDRLQESDVLPENWRQQIEIARLRLEEWRACVQARRFKCDDSEVVDPMSALLNDSTLESGDLVSTPSGMRVFRGQSEQLPHRLDDFQPR
jgi:hypothetical protein